MWSIEMEAFATVVLKIEPLGTLASSISPSSASTLSGTLLAPLEAPSTLSLIGQQGKSADVKVKTYVGRGLGRKSAASGFRAFTESFSGFGVEGFADEDRTPVTFVPAILVDA